MNLMPYLAVWVIMILGVLFLAVHRKRIAGSVDQGLHVTAHGDVARQAAVAAKLEKIERWGKILTVLVVLYGLTVFGIFLYKSFTSPSLG